MVALVLVEVMSRAVDKTFSYNIPKELIDDVAVGKRVVVPFGRKQVEGFVLEIVDDITSDYQLKDIISVNNDIVLTEELLSLGRAVSYSTLAPLISCYQAMLPKALKIKQKKEITKKYETYYKVIDNSFKLSDKQSEIVNIIKDKTVSEKELVNVKKISKARLNLLVEKKVLAKELRESYRLEHNDISEEKNKLTPLQEKVTKEIIDSIDTVYLLHGVTGSGKTEVYMTLIEEGIKRGKQSIVLVPEISLTPQTLARFEKRFGKRVAVFHSALSEGEKYDEYRRVARGEVNVIVGTRSAIFAPLKDISYIIMDEEHSDSYKQENSPRYDTKMVALERCRYHKAKLILGSATPTLESYARALKGVYHLVNLKERVGGRNLPKVEFVDMNKAIATAKGHFSLELIKRIEETLRRGEQVILLLNRRGYSSVLSCKNCGYVMKCPNCDISLTYHKTNNMLRCHYCGYATNYPKVCPECKEEALRDLGVGTEKIEEEVKSLFGNSKVLRMDVDTTSKKNAHQKIIESFAKGEASILIGTQMVAKGLDFPNVTLVGVLNTDTSLMIPDFRSSETTFDLLSQVAGRSGRAKEGLVVFQTYNKDHYAISCASKHDYLTFYKEEMAIRKMMKYPPYYYLVLVKISGKDENSCLKEAVRCEKVLKKYLDKTILLGPTKAMIFKKMNIYTYQIILKYQYQDNLYEILDKLLNYYATKKIVEVSVTFNPVHL
ncbi:MAG: primosomal protein N' [Clostridium sp.]|nr:primosomal protein N' [Clostridium sp.]